MDVLLEFVSGASTTLALVNATRDPSGEISTSSANTGAPLTPSTRLTISVVPDVRSRTYARTAAVDASGCRFVALERKATLSPRALIVASKAG